MLIDFSKMHGLGNDFMVVDGVTQKVFFSNDVIKKLADRHFGIGFDQLLLVEPPMTLNSTFTIAFSMPMAARWSSAATAPAVLPVSCVSRG